MPFDSPIPPMPPPIDETPGFGWAAIDSRSKGPRGRTAIAWLVIVMACSVMIGRHLLMDTDKPPPGKPPEDRIGVLVMELQAKYAVGAGEVAGNKASLYAPMKQALNMGTVDQRQRFVILAGELKGHDEAHRVLTELSDMMATAQQNAESPLTISPEQGEVQRVLQALYPSATDATDEESGGSAVNAAAESSLMDSLSSADRELLVHEMGWFGRLALAPSGSSDTAAREAIVAPATTLMYFIVAVAIGVVALGVLGFAGLVVMIVLAFMGKVRSELRPSGAHHGLYAETFAVWMFLFIALQYSAGAAEKFVPNLALAWVAIAFFASLFALAWPVFRGVPWLQVKQDIGWVGGRVPALTPLIGLAGYVMTLPILGIGLAMTLGLIKLQEVLSPPGNDLQSASGPAHPIIEQLADGDWTARIAVLFLGAIAAPIIEETMFRGTLYRHLREASAATGIIMSIIIATLINSFIFAAIHPQGWVAVPALMSLAVGFSLMREWQGSVIPCMIMHGTSNFLVLTILLMAISL